MADTTGHNTAQTADGRVTQAEYEDLSHHVIVWDSSGGHDHDGSSGGKLITALGTLTTDINLDGNDLLNAGNVGNDLKASGNTLLATAFSGAITSSTGGNTLGATAFSGAITVSTITQTVDDSGIILRGGSAADKGAMVVIRGESNDGGSLELYTENVGGTEASRLKFSGGINTSVATWSNVTHTGLVLSGAMACGGNAITNMGDSTLTEFLRHEGDANTYLRFRDDRITCVIGGADVFDANGTNFDFQSTQSVINVGDAGNDFQTGGNNLIATTFSGQLVLSGDARVSVHTSFGLSGIGQGATAPTLTRDTNTVGWKFTINDDGYIEFEVPQSWDSSTDIDVELHVYVDEAFAANSGEVRFQATWSAIPDDGSETIDGATHTGTLDSGDINIPATAKSVFGVDLGVIAAASLAVNDVVYLKISRIGLVGGNNPTAHPVVIAAEHIHTNNSLGGAI